MLSVQSFCLKEELDQDKSTVGMMKDMARSYENIQAMLAKD